MQMSTTPTKIEAAVDAIIADLRDRRGLRQEWDQIDEEIALEIRDEWVRILEENLDAGTK